MVRLKCLDQTLNKDKHFYYQNLQLHLQSGINVSKIQLE